MLFFLNKATAVFQMEILKCVPFSVSPTYLPFYAEQILAAVWPSFLHDKWVFKLFTGMDTILSSQLLLRWSSGNCKTALANLDLRTGRGGTLLDWE